MKTLVVIPARYASTRFPGKPLALLGGRPVVEWVWRQVAEAQGVSRAVVATDDARIAEAVERFGGEAMLTSEHHRSGTDRCGEVVERLCGQGEDYEVVVNVQGDEPFVEASQIEALLGAFARKEVSIATLCTPILTTEELLSANNVKVVVDAKGNAMYFSRQPIPFQRDAAPDEWVARGCYRKHVGIYAFRAAALQAACGLPMGGLEQCEKLEQLRWLEAGMDIAVVGTSHANIGIDTPADLAEAERRLIATGNTEKTIQL